MTLCICMQVTHATDIPPVVSDHGSLPRATLSSVASHLLTNGSVPRCAMNPAYEYALPTQVARLMAGPTVETTFDADTPEEAKGGPLHAHGGSRGGIIRRLQLPIHAATQPADLASLRPVSSQTEDSGGSGAAGGSVPGRNTAPLASARPDELRQESLEAQSEADSTTAKAPDMLPGGKGMSPVHTQDQTVGGTETATTQLQDDVELPPPPLPPKREIFGIRLGRAHDTESTRDSTGSSALRGGRQQRWRRSWLPSSVGPSTVESATEEVSATAVLTAQQLMDRLHRQLDGFESSDQFLGRFELLGRNERRRGGASAMALRVQASCNGSNVSESDSS